MGIRAHAGTEDDVAFMFFPNVPIFEERKMLFNTKYLSPLLLTDGSFATPMACLLTLVIQVFNKLPPVSPVKPKFMQLICK